MNLTNLTTTFTTISSIINESMNQTQNLTQNLTNSSSPQILIENITTTLKPLLLSTHEQITKISETTKIPTTFVLFSVLLIIFYAVVVVYSVKKFCDQARTEDPRQGPSYIPFRNTDSTIPYGTLRDEHVSNLGQSPFLYRASDGSIIH